MKMTRKILEEKVATFNSMFEASPGLPLQREYGYYNLVPIDPITKRQYRSVISQYGLSAGETARYLDGLIRAARHCRDGLGYLERNQKNNKLKLD